MDEVLDLVARARGDDEVEPVAARLVARRGDDLDDVAVAQPGAERHHLAVDARADALMADVGVDRVGEVDRRRVARQRLDLAFRREDVDLLRVQLDLQVLQELLRIAHLLLPFEQLPQPEEVLLVAVRRRPVLPCISSAPRSLPRPCRCISSVRICTSNGKPRSLTRPTCAATGSRWAAASR